MSEQKPQSEDLIKSIEALIDEVFAEEAVEKSIEIAKDASTTADAALKNVPKAQDDASRGAGRSKEISEIPETDEDGKREGNYTDSIAQASKEEENPEAKQSPALDQSSEKNRMSSSPKAPQMRPFMKSLEVTEEEYAAFEAFKKAQVEAQVEAQAKEELKKAETLVKAAVTEATASLIKENEALRKSMTETQELIKAMAAKPREAKSITSIEVLEKSQERSEKGSEEFSKSEKLDAAFELVKAGKLKDTDMAELEMTGTIYNPESRAAIEKFLNRK